MLLLTALVACETKSEPGARSSQSASPHASAPVYRAEVLPPDMTVQEKKLRFRSLVLPAVEVVYDELASRYAEAERLADANPDSPQLEQLRASYKVEDNRALLLALKPHPISVSLAQAAMESAWGTSRFFREANNIFGIWSFDASEPRIAAGEKHGDTTIWVKKYASLEASVRDYCRTLARGRAFDEFRELKLKTDDPFALVEELDRYSERGAEYGKELASMIRYNKFQEFDRQPEETRE